MAKKTIIRITRQPGEWGKTFESNSLDKGLIFSVNTKLKEFKPQKNI
jgi:hypothetical protein